MSRLKKLGRLGAGVQEAADTLLMMDSIGGDEIEFWIGRFWKMRKDDKTGCVTAYKKSLGNVQNYQIDFRVIATMSPYSHTLRSFSAIKSNGAIILQIGFEDIHRKIFIANIHLTSTSPEARGSQIFFLCQELKQLKDNGFLKEEDGLIICGDFNSVPESSIYKAMTTKLLHLTGDLHELQKVFNNLQYLDLSFLALPDMRSAYATAYESNYPLFHSSMR
ncbi:uncharacterized protein LOC109834854 [Asparagus officinalis]|uniref:uncharacterized protein LOC109834854 n=1 Tax=Asparagus officinalis TaxID=4686 RepID=UPI00098E2326|nr:uncharacterized protein LOC109834854 [Asparagus officinalis]